MQGFRDKEFGASGLRLLSRMLMDTEVAMRKKQGILPAGMRVIWVVVLMLAGFAAVEKARGQATPPPPPPALPSMAATPARPRASCVAGLRLRSSQGRGEGDAQETEDDEDAACRDQGGGAHDLPVAE